MISVDYVDHMGTDLSIVNAARVSFHKHHDTFEDKDAKLIRYLANHGHWTPFSHTAITVRVRAPVFVRTQCFKHKVGFTENEVSRRYVTEEPEFFTPNKWRTAPVSAKQGSGNQIIKYLNVRSDAPSVNEVYNRFCRMSYVVYQDMIDSGIAPEQARMVLPQSMMTEWYWTGSLIAFTRMYNLRSDPHAQEEVQQVAHKIKDILEPLFPVSWNELTKKENHGE